MAHEFKGDDPHYNPADYAHTRLSPAEALRMSVSVRAAINLAQGKDRLSTDFVKSWALAKRHTS